MDAPREQQPQKLRATLQRNAHIRKTGLIQLQQEHQLKRSEDMQQQQQRTGVKMLRHQELMEVKQQRLMKKREAMQLQQQKQLTKSADMQLQQKSTGM